MRYILGFLLMVRGIAPVLAVLVLAWGASRIVGSLQAAVAEPLAQIDAGVQALEATAETAQVQVEQARTQAEALIAQVQAVSFPDFLPDLGELRIPGFDIPDLRVPMPTSLSIEWRDVGVRIPVIEEEDCGIFDWFCEGVNVVTGFVNQVFQYPAGIDIGTTDIRLNLPALPDIPLPLPDVFGLLRDALNAIFGDVFAIFDVFGPTMERLDALGQSVAVLPPHLEAALDGVRALVDNLGALLARWWGLLLLVLGIVLGLLILSVGTTMLDDILRGWRLVFGGGAVYPARPDGRA